MSTEKSLFGCVRVISGLSAARNIRRRRTANNVRDSPRRARTQPAPVTLTRTQFDRQDAPHIDQYRAPVGPAGSVRTPAAPVASCGERQPGLDARARDDAAVRRCDVHTADPAIPCQSSGLLRSPWPRAADSRSDRGDRSPRSPAPRARFAGTKRQRRSRVRC